MSADAGFGRGFGLAARVWRRFSASIETPIGTAITCPITLPSR
jgi:hypothetical protein